MRTGHAIYARIARRVARVRKHLRTVDSVIWLGFLSCPTVPLQEILGSIDSPMAPGKYCDIQRILSLLCNRSENSAFFCNGTIVIDEHETGVGNVFIVTSDIQRSRWCGYGDGTGVTRGRVSSVYAGIEAFVSRVWGRRRCFWFRRRGEILGQDWLKEGVNKLIAIRGMQHAKTIGILLKDANFWKY